ncbi:DUF982 domain-containing protein [Mesorhizobium comanense]|uniref:DUF982 domain-containing protein n=1 Tax=Mesorhizobium comanense TaxID=2502215 RepID=UPI0010F879CB|nr:DUF982 domain-containing protein [Mesorhizobium comanense]
MDIKKLRTPVVVYIPGPTGFVIIASFRQASDFLFEQWPGHDGPAWTDAMKCCDGDGAIDQASLAFLTALKEAGICYDRTLEIL